MMKKWLTWIKFSKESQDLFCVLSWTPEADLAVQIWTKGDSKKKKWMFGAMRIIEKVSSGEVFSEWEFQSCIRKWSWSCQWSIKRASQKKSEKKHEDIIEELRKKKDEILWMQRN